MDPEMMKALSDEVNALLDHVEQTSQDRCATYAGRLALGASDVWQAWGSGLAFVMAVEELVMQLGKVYGEAFTAGLPEHDSSKLRAMLQVYMRASLTILEVRTNLSLGLAHAAHITCRTLYELTVILGFLAKHDEDTGIRYMHHYAMQLHKYALADEELAKAQKREPHIGQAERDAVAEEYRRLQKLYGKSYKRDYGWATIALGFDVEEQQGPRATLEAIEKNAGLNFRPQYKLLSAFAHPSSLGSRLVLDRDEVEAVDVVQTGATTDSRLAEPAVQAIEYGAKCAEFMAAEVPNAFQPPDRFRLNVHLNALRKTAEAGKGYAFTG